MIGIIKGPASDVNTAADDEINYSNHFELVNNQTVTSLNAETSRLSDPVTEYYTTYWSTVQDTSSVTTSIPSPGPVSYPVSVRFIVGITIGGFG